MFYCSHEYDKQHLLQNYRLSYVGFPHFFGYPSIPDSEQYFSIPFQIIECLRTDPRLIGTLHDNYRPLSLEEYDPKQHTHCLVFIPISKDFAPSSPSDIFYPCNAFGQPMNPHTVAQSVFDYQTIQCERGYRLKESWEGLNYDCYILRPTAEHLKTLQAASQTPDTDHTLKLPSYIDKAIQLSKQTAQVGNLQLHYQRNNQSKLSNQKYAYYRVVDSKQQHHMGMLDQYGKDMLSGLPYGPVGLYYGLLKVDADIEAHSQLGKKHQQLIQNFKKSLDQIIEQTKVRAAKQRAALKKKGFWGEGWAYTKAFFEGFKEGAESLIETTVNTLSAPFTALDELANTMVDCLAQGNIEPLKQDYHKLETGIEATADDFAKLARLMTDPECLLMIVNFPKRYLAVDSGIDEVRMIGQLGPMIIIMLITAGAGALAAGSADTATITEEIGGETGTIARKEVQIADQGVVDSDDSKVDTVKGLSDLNNDKRYNFKPGELEIHFKKHGAGFKKLANAASYTKENYLDDANTIIQNGIYSEKLHSYIRIAGGTGKAKVVMAGLDRASDELTTLHIKTIKYLIKADPDINWEI